MTARGRASYQQWSSGDYRGHGDVAVVDALGHTAKSWFFVREPLTFNGTTYDRKQVEALQGRPYINENKPQGASLYLSRKETDWAVLATAVKARHVRPIAERTFSRKLDGGVDSGKTEYAYDTYVGNTNGYGNVAEVREYGSASAATGAWLRKTTTEYLPAVDGGMWLVGKPARVRLWRPPVGGETGDQLVRETHYLYDGATRYDTTIGSGLNGGNTSKRGLLTAVRKKLSGTQWVDTTFTYDAYGNKLTETEYNSYGTAEGTLAATNARTTTATYDSLYHTFLATLTNPLNQQESRTYDARFGLLTARTDSNGATSNVAFDGFGRLTKTEGPQVTGPNGSPYRKTSKYAYDPPATASGRTTNRVQTDVRTDLGSSTEGGMTWLTSSTICDGLGRVVQTLAPAQDGVNVVNTYYSSRGLEWKKSMPHRVLAVDGGTAGLFLVADWTSSSGASSETSFDPLGRALVEVGSAPRNRDQAAIV